MVEIKLNSAEHVDIVIEDDGSGLEPQELSLIFDAFFRSQRHSNRRVDGFGLGLAIASRAVQLHKGDIDAKNRSCKGLKITITLPLTGDNSSVID